MHIAHSSPTSIAIQNHPVDPGLKGEDSQREEGEVKEVEELCREWKIERERGLEEKAKIRSKKGREQETEKKEGQKKGEGDR